jgi:hypothetical protein
MEGVREVALTDSVLDKMLENVRYDDEHVG